MLKEIGIGFGLASILVFSGCSGSEYSDGYIEKEIKKQIRPLYQNEMLWEFVSFDIVKDKTDKYNYMVVDITYKNMSERVGNNYLCRGERRTKDWKDKFSEWREYTRVMEKKEHCLEDRPLHRNGVLLNSPGEDFTQQHEIRLTPEGFHNWKLNQK